MSTSARRLAGKFHHGDLRRALIEATSALIERDGPAAVSLREAARRAGVSHNAPYRHFADREALLAEVAAHGFDRLASAFRAALEGEAEDRRMIALGQAYLRFAAANPGLFRLMFGSGLSKDAHPGLRRAADDALAVLQNAVAQAASPAPRETALGAWALVHGLAHLVVDNQLSPDLQKEAAEGGLLERIGTVFGFKHPGPT